MREFKLVTNNKRNYHEGRVVVWVGYLIYVPTCFDALRRVRLKDDGGRIDQIEIDADHPLWNEFVGIEFYSI
jgi:hypothetical protein